MKKIDKESLEASLTGILREAGYRATPGKIDLLKVFKAAKHPLTSAEVLGKLTDKKDETTVYRSIEALHDSGLLRKVQFNDRSARYEWNVDRPHHHHIVCENCGLIEDVDIEEAELDAGVLKKTTSFVSIKSHSVEFFGRCRDCENK